MTAYGMDRFRLPFFVVALLLMVAALGTELSANAVMRALAVGSGDVDPTGFGIPCMALIDALLLFTTLMIALPMIISHGAHARVQGLITLIVSILAILGGIVAAIAAFMLLMLMITLLLAVPFGTIAYFAAFGDFAIGQAQAFLAVDLLLKIAAAICLVLAHQRFLQNRGLVLIVLTSLVANVIVGFLQNLVPTCLVSITDAVAALIVLIIGIIWALVFLIRSLPAIVKAVA